MADKPPAMKTIERRMWHLIWAFQAAENAVECAERELLKARAELDGITKALNILQGLEDRDNV